MNMILVRWKTIAFVVLAAVLPGTYISFAQSRAAQPKVERIRWEYKVFTTRVDGWPSQSTVAGQNMFLNEAGSDGWELVSVESGQILHVCYLKRRLP